MIRRFSILLCLVLAPSVFAANRYVRDGGTGSGTSWSDAYDQLSSAETAASRGDTIYVADGTYNAVTFNTATSGTQTITIKKATIADHGTDTGWSDAYGDGVATFTSGFSITTPYWIIDGASNGGLWATSGHGFKIDVSGGGKGINWSDSGAGHCTVSYVEIQGAGDDGDGGGNDGVYTAVGASDITLSNCYIHDMGRTHGLLRNTSGWIIEYCVFERNESTAAEHSESWSIGVSNSITFRHNYWNECEGTGLIAVLDSASGPTGADIHGNVIRDSTFSNGMITTDTGSEWSGISFHNNTIYNCSNCDINPDNGTVNTAYNNLFWQCDLVFANFTHDYNASEDNLSESNDQTLSGDPFTSIAGGDFTLASATTAGTTLSSPYDTDVTGATRGVDGTWDRGAYEYGAPPAGTVTLSTLNATTLRVE